MKLYIASGLAVVMMIGSGIVQGRWSERWTPLPELDLFAEQLDKVPMKIGEWQGEDSEQPDQRELDFARVSGSLSRMYRKADGQAVSIFIVCGRLRDVFAHSPDRCYPSAGFQMLGEPLRTKIETGGETAEFYSTTFRKSEPTSVQNLRIYWSWCGTGPWEAPSDPRWSFAGHRVMYKVYVVTTARDRDPVEKDDSAAQFIRVLIPELQKAFQPAIAAAA